MLPHSTDMAYVEHHRSKHSLSCFVPQLPIGVRKAGHAGRFQTQQLPISSADVQRSMPASILPSGRLEARMEHREVCRSMAMRSPCSKASAASTHVSALRTEGTRSVGMSPTPLGKPRYAKRGSTILVSTICATPGLHGIAKAGRSCDELNDLGGWKSRSMVDRYAKFATDNLGDAAARIDSTRAANVTKLVHFLSQRRGGRGQRSKLTS